jgi:cell division protein FtsW (lipid II flippase)
MGSRSYAILALAFVIIACYCLTGLAMNASFSAASDETRYARAAIVWTVAGLIALALASAFAITAWRKRRQ